MQVEALLQTIVAELRVVAGVQALVLGGSRARGTHTPTSDIDLGIYYHPDSPLDMEHLSKLATALDDEHRADVITPIGGWGPWINGGGWLTIQGYHVDFLYRDLQKVSNVIESCLHGQVEMFYQPGHPHGFVSSIYLAEVAVCKALWDPHGVIAGLKWKVDPYPESLQDALIQKFAWEIDFSLLIAKKGVERAEAAYAAGCFFRSVMCMLQVLFALNKTHWLNEKGAVAIADTFTLKPPRFRARVEEAFRFLAAESRALQKAADILEGLSQEIHALVQSRQRQIWML